MLPDRARRRSGSPIFRATVVAVISCDLSGVHPRLPYTTHALPAAADPESVAAIPVRRHPGLRHRRGFPQRGSGAADAPVEPQLRRHPFRRQPVRHGGPVLDAADDACAGARLRGLGRGGRDRIRRVRTREDSPCHRNSVLSMCVALRSAAISAPSRFGRHVPARTIFSVVIPRSDSRPSAWREGVQDRAWQRVRVAVSLGVRSHPVAGNSILVG